MSNTIPFFIITITRYYLLKPAFYLFFLIAFQAPGVAQSLSVTEISDLEFGEEIFPGIDKSINRSEAGAAEFKISGEGDREVEISFQLPDYLTDSSNNELSIFFSSDDSAYNSIEDPAGATSFDPHNGVIVTLSQDGNLYIWLGGTVSPLSSQPGNFYEDDITLNVSYTTN